MIEKPVVFKNKGMQLVGMLHLPKKVENAAAGIIICHGFSGNKVDDHRILVDLARTLCKEGFAILRFDFRFHGDSEGDFCDLTIDDEISDLNQAVGFLCSVEEVDQRRIGVLGYSLGGVIAVWHAAKDTRIKAVCTWSTLSNLFEFLKVLFGGDVYQRTKGGERVKLFFENTGNWILNPEFFLDVEANRYDLIKVVKDLSPRPILIVHGVEDQIVNVSDAHELYASANDPKTLEIIKGADHHYRTTEFTDELIKKTVSWFKEVFKVY